MDEPNARQAQLTGLRAALDYERREAALVAESLAKIETKLAAEHTKLDRARALVAEHNTRVDDAVRALADAEAGRDEPAPEASRSVPAGTGRAFDATVKVS